MRAGTLSLQRLLVQEALDAHLRGLLEGHEHGLDLGDLAVVRELAVAVHLAFGHADLPLRV